MTNLELLEAMGEVDTQYLQEAQTLGKGKKGTVLRWPVRTLAAMLAIALVLGVFFQTPTGAAALDYVGQQVNSLIETLFPPKDMTILVEGQEVTGSYVAGGVAPEEAPPAVQAPAEPSGQGQDTPADLAPAVPGFAIYYEKDAYIMEQEGDTTYIRSYSPPMTREEVEAAYGDVLEGLPEEEREAEIAVLMEGIQPDPSLPPCELAIDHLTLSPEEAVAQEQADLQDQWAQVQQEQQGNRYSLHLQGGNQWNSPVEVRFYYSDGQGGCFRLTSRYFLEAAEGHGARFAAMVDTFSVVPAQTQP